MPNNLKHAINANLRTLRTTEDEQASILRNCLEGRRAKHRLSVAFVVTLILILLAATALAVTAITGHLRFMKPEEGPQALNCTIYSDTLYMMTNDGLMQWQPTDETPEKLMDAQELQAQGISIFSMPFHTDTLMLLDPKSMTVWRYDNGIFKETLNFSDAAAQFGDSWLSHPVAADGYLFIRAVADGALETEAMLWRIDLSTGQAEALDVPNVIELTAYRDGLLLTMQRNLPDEADTLIAVDAYSGEAVQEITYVPPLTIEGIAYSTECEAILAIYDGTLSQWSGSRWIPRQTASIPPLSFYYGAIGGGYVAASYTGVQFISLDMEETEPALVIRGWRNPYSIEDDFIQANPGIQMKRENEARFNGMMIAEALEAGDDVDLFYVRLDAAVIQLIRDGKLAPLSQYVILASDIAQMLSQVQSAVAPSGTAYALPASLKIPLWMIRNDADNEPPSTLLKLLAQDVAWNEDAHDKAIYIANDSNAVHWTKRDYARYAVNQAYDEALTDGQIPDFSAKEFTEFLEALKNAKLSAISNNAENTLITPNSFYMLRGRTSDDPWLSRRLMSLPAVTATETDAIPAWLLVYVLNPNSKNMQTALDFLEYTALNRYAGDQAMLSPGTAEPSLYAYAQEPGFEGLQSLPDSWEVAADALAQYQTEIAPRLMVSFSPYSSKQDLMLETVMQYMNDEITLEQCTQQLNTLAAGETAE